jgi:hypothetical protein
VGVWSYDLHVIGCEPAKCGAFPRIYGGQRLAESIVGTGLNLDEDDRVAVAAKQVDLAARQAKVPSDYAITGRLQEPRSAILAGAAFNAVS